MNVEIKRFIVSDTSIIVETEIVSVPDEWSDEKIQEALIAREKHIANKKQEKPKTYYPQENGACLN